MRYIGGEAGCVCKLTKYDELLNIKLIFSNEGASNLFRSHYIEQDLFLFNAITRFYPQAGDIPMTR
jgi:hypothetical protein